VSLPAEALLTSAHKKALDNIKLEGDEAVGAEIVRRALEFPTRPGVTNEFTDKNEQAFS
jgi:hypothetical protein